MGQVRVEVVPPQLASGDLRPRAVAAGCCGRSLSFKRGLTECIGCGCLPLDRCWLANPSDRAGAGGPGPRCWLGDQPLR